MKKLILVVVAVSLSISCKKTSYTVTIDAKGVKKSKEAYIQTISEMGVPVSIDTAKVKDSKVVFEGKKDYPEFAFVSFKDEASGPIPFIIENGSIEIKIDSKDAKNSTVGGTNNNDLFQKFNDSNKSLMKEVEKFQKENQMAMMQAQQSNDVAKMTEIQNKFKTFQDRMNDGSKKFIADNKNNLITAILLKGLVMSEKVSAKEAMSYFDGFDENLKKSKAAVELKKFLDDKSKEAKKK